jgi:hypothetical protein
MSSRRKKIVFRCSVKEAAEICGCTQAKIKKAVAEGRIVQFRDNCLSELSVYRWRDIAAVDPARCARW